MEVFQWILPFPACIYVYIYYILYTPNLGIEITVSGREREQGRYRKSSEGVRCNPMG